MEGGIGGHGHSHGGDSGSDDVHKYWSAMPSSPSTYEVVIGDKLSFKYTEYHNVYLMPSQEAYESCDFSAATELANTTYGGGEGSKNNNWILRIERALVAALKRALLLLTRIDPLAPRKVSASSEEYALRQARAAAGGLPFAPRWLVELTPEVCCRPVKPKSRSM